MTKRILAIVTNTTSYAASELKTGLWLSELTHLYDAAKKEGYEVTIASPKGGNVPIDPESLKPWLMDSISKQVWKNKIFRKQLEHSYSLQKIAQQDFDLVYLAGGHGTMYDFPHNEELQLIVRRHYEAGKLVSAICHGVGGLLNVRLSNGKYLLQDKRFTGFSWFEETLARRKKQVPFNLEEELCKRTQHYTKSLIPMTSKVVVDFNLITGQNPFSSKETAQVLIELLKG